MSPASPSCKPTPEFNRHAKRTGPFGQEWPTAREVSAVGEYRQRMVARSQEPFKSARQRKPSTARQFGHSNLVGQDGRDCAKPTHDVG